MLSLFRTCKPSKNSDILIYVFNVTMSVSNRSAIGEQKLRSFGISLKLLRCTHSMEYTHVLRVSVRDEEAMRTVIWVRVEEALMK